MLTLDSTTTNHEQRSVRRLAEVYVDHNRPFNDGNIVEDLRWRRTHTPPLTNGAMRTQLAMLGILTDLGVSPEQVDVRYSRNAGCHSCPCSPGYVVTRKQSAAAATPVKMYWLK